MFGLSFSPWILIGALVGSIALAAGGYYEGSVHTADRYQIKIDKLQADAATEVQKVRDANIAQANAAVSTLESKNAEARVVYKTITHDVDRIVEKPIYRQSCFDDQGLSLANAALAGVAVSLPSPLPAVPMRAATSND